MRGLCKRYYNPFTARPVTRQTLLRWRNDHGFKVKRTNRVYCPETQIALLDRYYVLVFLPEEWGGLQLPTETYFGLVYSDLNRSIASIDQFLIDQNITNPEEYIDQCVFKSLQMNSRRDSTNPLKSS